MGNKQRSKIESLDLVFSVHKNRQTTSRKEKWCMETNLRAKTCLVILYRNLSLKHYQSYNNIRQCINKLWVLVWLYKYFTPQRFKFRYTKQSLYIWELGASIYKHCKLEKNITCSLFLPNSIDIFFIIMIWLFPISIIIGILSSLVYKRINFSGIIKNRRKPNEMHVRWHKSYVIGFVQCQYRDFS